MGHDNCQPTLVLKHFVTLENSDLSPYFGIYNSMFKYVLSNTSSVKLVSASGTLELLMILSNPY